MATTVTLSAMPYAQAKVRKMDDGSIVLRSYYTDVASIDKDGWLTIYGLYSATTRKHIGAFLREYTNICFATAKMICKDGYTYNLHTGEVKKI